MVNRLDRSDIERLKGFCDGLTDRQMDICDCRVAFANENFLRNCRRHWYVYSLFIAIQDLSSSLVKEKKSSGDLLLRLFPSLSNSSDLGKLEDEAKEALEVLGRNEAQIGHYKSVLAQTETMLTSLQSSVEAAEAEWRVKLEAANK